MPPVFSGRHPTSDLAAHLHALELTLGDGGGCATYSNGSLAGLDGVGVGGVEVDVELVREYLNLDGLSADLGVVEGVLGSGCLALWGVGTLDVVPYIYGLCAVVAFCGGHVAASVVAKYIAWPCPSTTVPALTMALSVPAKMPSMAVGS